MTSRTKICAAALAAFLTAALSMGPAAMALGQDVAASPSPAVQAVLSAIASAEATIAANGLTGDEAAATLAAAISDALPADASPEEAAAILDEVVVVLQRTNPNGIPPQLLAAIQAVRADRTEAGNAPGAGGSDGARPGVPATNAPPSGAAGDDDALPDYNPA